MTLVLGHRGASDRRPENTIEAFEEAARLGADGVELDIRRTSDGRLVVCHDAVLADGRPIVSLPAAALPPALPVLEDVLRACERAWAESPSACLVNVEIKSSVGDPDFDSRYPVVDLLAEAVERAGGANRLLVSSFDLVAVDRCRVVLPTIETGWLTVAAPVGTAASIADRGHRFIHPVDVAVTREVVDDARANGLGVVVWTVDDPRRAAELHRLGVDIVITNVVDTIRGTIPG